ncbi:PREDICTED: homeobox protein CDX-4-like [Gekko japonicus]|uniref:Homeobox protein CDX-4-like n=1 Tax=Gekko japonicus TaxID=146911 RepID=A0ABM1L2Z4_GEKJA|nr:PREDICTED: homeobox protein CDX-4-like [Gekko japonicus]
MHVSCLPGKETSMYPGSIRSNNHSLPGQNFASGTPYTDYMGYHHAQSMDNQGQPSGGWGSPYSLQREDWSPYGPGSSSTSESSPGHGFYAAANYNSLNPAASCIDTINADHISPHNQRLRSYNWMTKVGSSNNAGKTRTKEKYRVVYTEQQRLELEKEFHSNRYITIKRKSELAADLELSERQVKIWFQNRRAKERKMIKKRISQFDGSSGSVQSDSGSVSPAEMSAALFPPSHTINGLQPVEILQVTIAD